MMSYRPLAAVITFALAATAVAATAESQAVPNLSGTWVLVPEKSDLGGVDAGGDRTDVIEHKGTRLTIQRTLSSPPVTATLVYAIDGKEYRNTIGDREVTSTLEWDGPVLVMKSKVATNQGEALLTDRYTLSANGKALTMARVIAVQGQELRQIMVFAKK